MDFPATTAEQRSPLYKDVEELVMVGFLSHPVEVNGKHLALRSLSEGDLYLMRQRAKVDGSWDLWTVAASVWLLDGHNLLLEPHASSQVASVLRSMPKSAVEALGSVTLGLFRRVGRARFYVEAFCYENASRYLWRSIGRRPPTGIGIPGAEKIGMNDIRGTWVAYNQAEDDRSRMDSVWEAAKLITSSQAPKAVSKIDQKDVQRRRDEKARRQRTMDHAYYYSKGLVDKKGLQLASGGVGTQIHSAHTEEELADEMRRWVAGEEDWHDRVVSAYKKRVIGRFEEQKRQHAERMAALQRVSEERQAEDIAPVPLVGYTQEQLQQILAKRPHGVRGTRRIYPDQDPRQYLYDRYLKNEPGAPQQMVVDEEGGLSPLDAEIAQRQVPFRSGSERR